MSTAACPDCGKVVPDEGKCVSCNLPPRHAGSRLTGIFLGLLAVLTIAYLLASR